MPVARKSGPPVAYVALWTKACGRRLEAALRELVLSSRVYSMELKWTYVTVIQKCISLRGAAIKYQDSCFHRKYSCPVSLKNCHESLFYIFKKCIDTIVYRVIFFLGGFKESQDTTEGDAYLDVTAPLKCTQSFKQMFS